MSKPIGTPIARAVTLNVITDDDPHNPKPGFGWSLSQPCLDEIKAIEDNIALAHRMAPFIWVG